MHTITIYDSDQGVRKPGSRIIWSGVAKATTNRTQNSIYLAFFITT